MLFGKLFARGACRCGSLSDALPLRAEPLPAARGTDPAHGPAFGPLPGPAASWARFTDGVVEVIYTTDAATHPSHALSGDKAALPAAAPQPCEVAGLALGTLRDAQVPAHVQQVALMGGHALKAYAGLGFTVPQRLTLRLCRFNGDTEGNFRGGTEPWLDWVWISTALAGADALLTVAHEVFHRVQYEYNATEEKASPLYAAFREGGARLAEDWVLDSGDRYLKDGREFLDDPGRPFVNCTVPGQEIAPHSYAAALFWRWMCEQHGAKTDTPLIGHDVMGHMLDCMVDRRGYTLPDLREARGRVFGEGHLDLFQHLDIAAGETLSTETDWGNFLVANWMHGTADPVEDRRFDYLEDMAAQGAFAKKRPFVWPGEELRAAELPFRFEIPRGAIRAGFASRYTVVDVAAGAPPLIQLDFAAIEGMGDPLVQVLMIRRDPDGIERLHDLLRSDRARWSCLLPTAGLSQIVVIVAAREKPGRYRLLLAPAQGRAVLHMAPCNAAPGRSYETDPREGAWPWASPDVALDGASVQIRPANRGDAPSGRLRIQLAAQGTTPALPLRAGAWQEVGETTLAPLAPGATGMARILWKPPRIPLGATAWGLRATVTDEAGGEKLVVLSGIGTPTRPARVDTVL